MKLNWGHKLVIFGISFMVFIIVLVYKMVNEKVDLVDENYYEKGMSYQDELNKFDTVEGVKSSIDFDLAAQIITFKSTIVNLTGKAYFYRAGDKKLDFSEPFTLNNKNEFTYNTANLAKGVWKITFEWTLNGKLMAEEKQIVLE
ncbi:MAG: FixH family protein [Bacteroidia bacterium]|nr:FixH family protein [Bacteroidia bacterium]MBP9687966.1 FixH family protein [Bacteroidia bacterium]MBP9687989.1 FixH family protein [Bacteroidia bacterium]